MKIAVIGAGYVGVGVVLAVAKEHKVVFVDVDEAKIERINAGHSPILDDKVESFFAKNKEHLSATSDLNQAIEDATYCFICVPTPFDEKLGRLDTSLIGSILSQIENLKIAKNPQILIRSTLNIDDGDVFASSYPGLSISVMPEFLREKYLYEDALSPSRIILGGDNKEALETFLEVYTAGLVKGPIYMFVSRKEATMIKLMSNSYLATRVAFFNEVDTLAEAHGLDSRTVIRGMGLDPRIGDYYNVPSTGFGGKCLPKDISAAISEMKLAGLEETLLAAVMNSNEIRKSK